MYAVVNLLESSKMDLKADLVVELNNCRRSKNTHTQSVYLVYHTVVASFLTLEEFCIVTVL